MSSGKNPSSSSECKSYTKDTCIRQHHSQPIKKDDHTNPTIYGDRKMIGNVSEIVHIPLQFQQFKLSLNLPGAAAAVLRHSPSTTRTLVRSVTGQYYIEINAPNSSNEATKPSK